MGHVIWGSARPIRTRRTRHWLPVIHSWRTSGRRGEAPPTNVTRQTTLSGYSGPLKEVPHEKFNVTIVPRSYCSPWKQSDDSVTLLANINAQLPEPPLKLSPANYKCFNRAPIPFEGTVGSMRVLPLPGFEMQQTFTEPHLTWERMCNRPNFNRTPAGWRAQYAKEDDL